MEMGNQIIEKLTCAISPLIFATLPVAYLGGHWAMPPLLPLPFSKQGQNQLCQVTEICHTLLMVSVAYGQGRTRGVE